MALSKYEKTLQTYLEDSPLIVLGSGASIPYGLPSMEDLAQKIKELDDISSDEKYDDFCKALNESSLEEAMDSVHLQQETQEKIKRCVWKEINEKDFSHFNENLIGSSNALSDLIRKVIAPTPNKATIVTTNYDRLAEYSADRIGATTVTGFEGNLIKKLEIPSTPLKVKRRRSRERVVDIWKVHGSLDWFLAPDGTVISFPFTQKIPNSFQPLIIPPGREKYDKTHAEPYRSIIAEADKAFIQARSYLCIGYGFNDEHIQPKLLAQIKTGKPIVILAKKMTYACKRYIVDAKIRKYLIFEEADETHTRVYGNSEACVYEGQFWSLDNFLKIW